MPTPTSTTPVDPAWLESFLGPPLRSARRARFVLAGDLPWRFLTTSIGVMHFYWPGHGDDMDSRDLRRGETREQFVINLNENIAAAGYACQVRLYGGDRVSVYTGSWVRTLSKENTLQQVLANEPGFTEGSNSLASRVTHDWLETYLGPSLRVQEHTAERTESLGTDPDEAWRFSPVLESGTIFTYLHCERPDGFIVSECLRLNETRSQFVNRVNVALNKSGYDGQVFPREHPEGSLALHGRGLVLILHAGNTLQQALTRIPREPVPVVGVYPSRKWLQSFLGIPADGIAYPAPWRWLELNPSVIQVFLPLNKDISLSCNASRSIFIQGLNSSLKQYCDDLVLSQDQVGVREGDRIILLSQELPLWKFMSTRQDMIPAGRAWLDRLILDEDEL